MPVPERNFGWMALLHAAILAGAAAEVVWLRRPFIPLLALPALVCLVLATWTRWWVIQTLGRLWNVGIMDSTRQGVVDTGPYRWIRHPNYVAVFVELLALPLVHTAWITAAVGAIAHVFVLRARIDAEDRVLLADAAYVARMGSKPRFSARHLPTATRPASRDDRHRRRGRRGASLAIALGRSGHTVELFDAQTFPRDKPCGEGIMPAGVSALRRLGVVDGAGGVPFHGVRYHAGTHVAVGRFPASARHGDCGRAQRRLVLDQCLFELAANTPGVTAHQGVAVEGPFVESDRVAGVHVNGGVRRASLVVAADGAHSRFRHRLHSERAGAAHADRGAAPLPARGGAHRRAVGGHLPRARPRVLRDAAARRRGARGPARRSRGRPFAARTCVRSLAARAARAARATRGRCADQRSASHAARGPRARAGTLPGVVLLGDAAGFLDPITGGGIAQALVTSERLAAFIDAHRGRSPDTWLPAFDRERQALLRDYRAAHARRAGTGPPPDAGARGSRDVIASAFAVLASRRRIRRHALAHAALPHRPYVGRGFRLRPGGSPREPPKQC